MPKVSFFTGGLSTFLKHCTLSMCIYIYIRMIIYIQYIYIHIYYIFNIYTYLLLHIHTWWTTSSSHRSESKMLRKPSHNESECLERTPQCFDNLSLLRRHLPSHTSAFKLSLFANVHDGRSAIKSRCMCSFVVLCRLGGASANLPRHVLPKFAQVRVASGFALAWRSEGCYGGYWWNRSCALPPSNLETTWNWEFGDTTRENLRVEWIQVIMTISRSNGLNLNDQRYWVDSLVPGNCQDVKT